MKNQKDITDKEMEEQMEEIVRHLIVMGWEMGKKQVETPYTYTCDTDKGEKYWKKIMSAIHRTEKRMIEEIFKLIEPVFIDWCNESQYITGAWGDGESYDSDKVGDWIEFRKKSAWKQFADMLDNRIAGKELLNHSKQG